MFQQIRIRKPVFAFTVCCATSIGWFGCFSDPVVPECRTLADCPSGQGYTACLAGHCYSQDECTERGPITGDGCCSGIEADRTSDLDCLVMDRPLDCRDPSGPTLDDDGNLFVSCVMTAENGEKTVVLRRLDVAGILSVPVTVGPGSSAANPVLGVGKTLYARYSRGMVRFLTSSLGIVNSVDTVTASGPLAANRGYENARTVVVWPGSDGRVYVYDEERETTFSFGPMRPDPGAAGTFQPTFSWNGRRLYFTWKSGLIDVWRTWDNPLGAVLSMQLPALPAGPAVDIDGRIFVPLVDGTLRCYVETEAARLEEIWKVEFLESDPDGRVFMLVRPDGTIVLVGISGRVREVRDMDSFGAVVGAGRFESGLADIHPVLSEAGRVIAVQNDGTIATMLPSNAGSVMEPGLRFSPPSPPDSDLTMVGTSLVYVSQAGSLVSWVMPEGPAPGRWTRGSGDPGSTGRISPPIVQESSN